jgi:hypothetical protein
MVERAGVREGGAQGRDEPAMTDSQPSSNRKSIDEQETQSQAQKKT